MITVVIDLPSTTVWRHFGQVWLSQIITIATTIANAYGRIGTFSEGSQNLR